MQPETQYYKAVPVSEKPEPGRITAITKEGKQVPYHYTGSDISFITLREQYTHYLQPIPIPDAAVLREALEGLLNVIKDSTGVAGYHLNGNVAEWDEFPEVQVAREALSAGDGWVRVEDGLPENREEVLCLSRGGWQRMIQKSWEAHTDQNEKWFIESFSHWRQLPPLPSPPIK